jgi:oligopeptide/dipeptide ABC transporter ATP-binding protein
VILQGEVPNPIEVPSGCRFHPRCPLVVDKCRTVDPEILSIGPGHRVACHLVTEGMDAVSIEEVNRATTI